jgi:hypothetical protein
MNWTRRIEDFLGLDESLGGEEEVAQSTRTNTMEMAPSRMPEAKVIGEEVEWQLFDRRSGRVTHGPWRSRILRGTTFNLNAALGSDEGY